VLLRPCSDANRSCKTRANSEAMIGHLPFPAFAIAYFGRNQFQMKRARSFSLAGLSEWILATIRSEREVTALARSCPVFSARKHSVTPVTFTQALRYGQSEGVTGDPTNGFTVLWASGGKVSDVASVIGCAGNSIPSPVRAFESWLHKAVALVQGSYGFDLELIVLRTDAQLQHYYPGDALVWHEGSIFAKG